VRWRKLLFGAVAVAALAYAAAAARFGLLRIGFLVESAGETATALALALLLFRLPRAVRLGRMTLPRRLYAFGLALILSSVLGLSAGPEEPSQGPSLAAAGAAAAAVLLCLALFLLMRELVFVQQARHTEAWFRLLVLSLALDMAFVLLAGPDRPAEGPGALRFDGTPFRFDFPNVFDVLLAAVSVVNGFRWKWIHYLNKKSKTLLFLTGLPVTVFFLSRTESLAGIASIAGRSAGALVSDIGLAVSVYLVLCLAGLLIHLPTAGLMDRKMREVRTFQDLSAALGADLDRDALAAKIPLLAAQLVDAETAWLELAEGEGYRLAAVHRKDDQSPQAPSEAGLAACRREALARGRTVLTNEPARGRGRPSEPALRGSLLVAPVALPSGTLGVLAAVKPAPFGFAEESQGLFDAFTRQAALSLENVRMVEDSLQRKKAEEELRLAHEAQMRLLPQRMPEVRGFDLDGLCITANEIGGDFFDVIPVGRQRLDLVIGDVSGKGAAAAFYMAEFKGVLQALVAHHDTPTGILTEMNAFVRTQCDPGVFLTLSYAIVDVRGRRVRFARAGHCPAGLIRGGAVKWFEPRGLGLGLVPDRMFRARLEEKTLALVPGDVLFFYTDGLTEARDRRGEEFGEARLEALLAERREAGARPFTRAVADRVDAFTEDVPRHDDITMLTLRVRPKTRKA
jgi:serine phosphatase RsbU (regulator of sigma subunit)